MAKKNEEVIDKKVRARLREDILTEINSTVKDEIVKEVINDVKESFDKNYKEEIKENIKSDIIGDIENTIKRDQAKLSRRKSFKIFRLNIYIILLIICSLLLIYRLYETGNFELKVVEKNPTTTVKVTEPTTSIVYDLSYYKQKYGYLLDNIKITNYELLQKDSQVKNMNMVDKLAIAYNTLTKEDIVIEGIITRIDALVLKSKYDSIFNDGMFSNTNFTVDDLNFAYSTSSDSYLAIGTMSNDNSYIIDSIYDIKENGSVVIISTYVGLVKDHKLYNINNLETVVKELKENDDISDVTSSLSKVDYTFEYSNGNFYLVRITNK